MKNLSYQKKFYLTMTGLLVLVWLSIQLSFLPTIKLKDKLNYQIEQLSKIQDAPIHLKNIKEELKITEQMIGDASGEEASTHLISKTGKHCKQNDLSLNEMPRKHIYLKDNFAIVTYQLRLQGTFKKLLHLAHSLEQYPEAGKLRSVAFYTQYNVRNKQKELFATYYIQSVGLLND